MTPPAYQDPTRGDPDNELDASLRAILPQGLPFAYGPVTFRPHLGYRFLYGDGISVQPGNQRTTAVNEIRPGILLNLGPKWILDYTPTLRYYSNKDFKDGVDHRVNFSGGTVYEDWALGLSQTYSQSTSPNVETASQAQRESFHTGLSANHQINSKLSLNLAASQVINSVSTFNSYRQWGTMDYLNCMFHRNLTAGVGLGFNYTDVDQGFDMTSEQFQARASWTVSTKFSLDVHGGGDLRQFLSGPSGSLLNPVYGAAIHYGLAEHTLLTLTADRTTSASYFSGSVSDSTSLSLRLSQRLLERFNLDLMGGYRVRDYLATTSGFQVTRSDTGYNFSARLGTKFHKRGTIGLSYHFHKNESTQQGHTFDSNMVGLDVGYRW